MRILKPKLKIYTTLDKVVKFLKRENVSRLETFWAERAALNVLQNVLKNEIFQTHSKTWKIEDEQQLVQRIKSGNIQPDGEQYSPKYLERKRRRGEYLPHKFENYAFWFGAQAKQHTHKIVMRFEDPGTIDTMFDYVSHHESKRSVLKAAMLLAWDRMMLAILNEYARGMMI